MSKFTLLEEVFLIEPIVLEEDIHTPPVMIPPLHETIRENGKLLLDSVSTYTYEEISNTTRCSLVTKLNLNAIT